MLDINVGTFLQVRQAVIINRSLHEKIRQKSIVYVQVTLQYPFRALPSSSLAKLNLTSYVVGTDKSAANPIPEPEGAASIFCSFAPKISNGLGNTARRFAVNLEDC